MYVGELRLVKTVQRYAAQLATSTAGVLLMASVVYNLKNLFHR